MLCLLTSNLKDHSPMGAEGEVSLVSPTKSDFPVNVPEVIQKIFKSAWFEIFSNGSFL